DPAAKRAYDETLRPAPRPRPIPQDEDDSAPLPLAPAEPVAPAPVVRPPRPVRRRDDGRRLPYRRLVALRHVLAAWDDAGHFLADAGRPLRRPAEAVELVGVLWALRGRLGESDAPAVGLPGQPGALVAALARQPLPLHTFRHLLP